jgi:hypothetical protein
MEITPTQVQSVQQLHRTVGDRTMITTRVYQDVGGKTTVQDVHYYIYNSAGRVEEAHKPQVDLRV